MIKQGKEGFDAVGDERRKTLKVTFSNDLPGIDRVNTDIFDREHAKEFLEFMKMEQTKAEKDIKRRRELIDDLITKRKKTIADLKKQGIKLEATLSPELKDFKKKFETISNWHEVYGKNTDQIKLQEEAIERSLEMIEFQKQKIALVESAAKCLDLK